ncbi:MAG: PorT family protein [Candidatus Cloacimonetes bacterium]|nr:PorT family protein [Candidatus Cloacimonadota bacterium]
MKKTLIILALTVLSLSLAFADVTYGLRGGLNMMNRATTQENALETGDRSGFHGGLVLQYRTDSNFIVQPEILYSQKGYTYKVLTVDTTTMMDYVEVPILLKYNIKAAKGLYIQPTVAPFVGYAVVGKNTFKGAVIEDETDILEDINRLNYGLDFGLDIQVIDRVLVGARYQLGLADFDGDNNVIEKNKKDTHNGLMVSLGFLF